MQGEGVERDLAKAENWLRKAAANDMSNGMYYLSKVIMEQYGHAGAPEAVQWLRRSMDLGYPDAARMVQYVRIPNYPHQSALPSVATIECPSRALLLIVASADAADGGGAVQSV